MSPRILWISDRPVFHDRFSEAAFLAEHTTAAEATERVRRTEYDVVVLELPLTGPGPEEMILALHLVDSTLPVVVHSPLMRPSEAVRLSRLGACYFIDGDRDHAQTLFEAARVRSGGELQESDLDAPWRRMLVGASREMRQVCHIIRMIGPRRSTVLITGETGTGKELAARALHMAGTRCRGPFVAINCSAVPASLIEDELFGHVRGAFTGAVNARLGRFEAASGGTLFLDEIGELPVELQAKLLRVLQERQIQRLGSSETVQVNVRVVAATNADLMRKIGQGSFREDLYYRLNVVPLAMPPLRQRRGDIPLLVTHLVEKICAAEELPTKVVTGEATELLAGCPWPGNVRQLENTVEMAIALSGERRLLDKADFQIVTNPGERQNSAGPVISLPVDGLDFERTLTSIERSILEQALRRTGGNKKAAAEMLNLKRTTLAAKVRSLESALCS